MATLEGAPAAQYMYTGAAMWLVVIVVTSVLLLQAAHRFVAQPGSQANRPSAPTVARDLMTSFHNQWIGFEERLARYWLDKDCDLEGRPLAHGDGHSHVVYGTILTNDRYNRTIQTERAIVRLTLIAITSMFLLWIAQWMFWVGLIDLSSKEYVLLRIRFVIVELTSSRYCPPKLELLTAVWIVTSAAVTVFAISPRVE
jgi:hypothetical protein